MNIDELQKLSQTLYNDLNNGIGDSRSNLLSLLEVERELTKREMIK